LGRVRGDVNDTGGGNFGGFGADVHQVPAFDYVIYLGGFQAVWYCFSTGGKGKDTKAGDYE